MMEDGFRDAWNQVFDVVLEEDGLCGGFGREGGDIVGDVL